MNYPGSFKDIVDNVLPRKTHTQIVDLEGVLLFGFNNPQHLCRHFFQKLKVAFKFSSKYYVLCKG